jgi:5-formyltetrahydrofolate cyclo-ligase
LADAAAKSALRERILAARRALPAEDRARHSHAIAARLAALDAFARARVVALYAATGAEVDTAPLAALALAAGKRVAYPRIAPGTRALAFAACSPADLVPGVLGTRAPPPALASARVDELDLVVVPGVAFDAEGRRLGRGGGYYDATLALLPRAAARLGVAFEIQVVRAVPEEPHDVRLDGVVTEARVLFPLTPSPASGIPSRP